MQNKTSTHVLLLALSYALLIVLVNPLGNFPINDDWAYARSVLFLVENGEFHLLDWGAMTLVSQVLWGALWVKLFGFSFEVLRFSTIFMGFVALLGSYYLLLSISKQTWVAMTGTLVLLVNPMFTVLVNSFMTDVPFLALSLWSAIFLVRAIQRDSMSDIILGLCFAIPALLLRQIALALPLAFLFAYAVRFWPKISIKRFSIAVTPFALSSLIYISYINWLKVNENLPHALTWTQNRINTNIIALFDNNYSDLIYYCRSVGGMLLYMGLFSLPFMLARFPGRPGEIVSGTKKRSYWITIGFLLIVITAILFSNDILMPVHGNLLTTWGIGPFSLRDVHALRLAHLEAVPRIIWQAVTVLSVLGALLLSFRVASVLRRLLHTRKQENSGGLADHWHEIFLLILIAAYVSPLLLTDYFDRYLLFLLPFVIALVAGVNNWVSKVNTPYLRLASLMLIPVYGIISVALTHDYMSWNRTRLEATNWVMDKYGVDHYSIDSGFELNGFYGYDPLYDNDQLKWVRDDKYVVAFGDVVPGYQLDKRFKVERILPVGPEVIIVLKRSE
jgi:hypothetical protein